MGNKPERYTVSADAIFWNYVISLLGGTEGRRAARKDRICNRYITLMHARKRTWEKVILELFTNLFDLWYDNILMHPGYFSWR